MYIVTVLFALVVLTVAQIPPEFEKIMEDCAAENNVDPKIVKHQKMTLLPEEDNVKCFVKCTMVKVGHMDPDGTIHKEKMMEKFKTRFSDHFEELEKCLDVTNENACEKAFAVQKCVAKLF